MAEKQLVRKGGLQDELGGLSPMQEERLKPLGPPQAGTGRVPETAPPSPMPAGQSREKERRGDRVPDSGTARAGQQGAVADTAASRGGSRAPRLQGADNQGFAATLEIREIQREATRRWLAGVIPLAPTDEMPDLHIEEPSYFSRIENECGFSPTGFYQFGTDNVHVTNAPQSGADRAVLLVHEDLHFFSRDGLRIFFERDDGNIARPGYIAWMNEGMTELFAQTIVRENGMAPGSVGYSYETLTAHYLLMAVSTAAGSEQIGREAMLTAYMTGDFSRVRALADATLGEGSFERLLGMQTGAEALGFIRSRIPEADQAGMIRAPGTGRSLPLASWLDNPIAKRARMQIALSEVSGRPMPTLGRTFD